MSILQIKNNKFDTYSPCDLLYHKDMTTENYIITEMSPITAKTTVSERFLGQRLAIRIATNALMLTREPIFGTGPGWCPPDP
jgi:hypothetical protein